MSGLLNAARANIFLSVTNIFVALIGNIILVRVLSPAVYGEYATMLSIVAWGLIIFEAGGNSGLMRFLPELERFRSRGGFLVRIIRLRLMVGIIVVALMFLCGPLWVRYAGLSADIWSRMVFVALGCTIAAGLIGLPAQFAMLSIFQHRSALAVSQAIAITRVVIVAVCAWYGAALEVFACVVAAVACVEAVFFYFLIQPFFSGEMGDPPAGFVFSAFKHGLVTVFDKVSSQVGSGSFLLIALASSKSPSELALLALGYDVALKALSIAGAPIGALIVPYFNSSRVNDGISRATELVSRSSAVLLFTCMGGYLVLVPFVLPFLFGESYRDAVLLAQIFGVFLFIDSWGRQSFSVAMITSGFYRSINILNTIQGALALVLLILTWNEDILTVVGCQAMLRVLSTVALVVAVVRFGLLKLNRLPIFCFLSAAVAAVVIIWCQSSKIFGGSLWGFVASLFGYIFLVVAAMRSRYFLDDEMRGIAYRLLGARGKWLSFILGDCSVAAK